MTTRMRRRAETLCRLITEEWARECTCSMWVFSVGERELCYIYILAYHRLSVASLHGYILLGVIQLRIVNVGRYLN